MQQVAEWLYGLVGMIDAVFGVVGGLFFIVLALVIAAAGIGLIVFSLSYRLR